MMHNFFKSFTLVREKVESTLIVHKDLLATVLQKLGSRKRVDAYYTILNSIYNALKSGEEITQEKIVTWGGVYGKVIVGDEISKSVDFSDETKSKVFIYSALKSALKCPVCSGFIDMSKSVSYDHSTPVREGGRADGSNCQIMHPFCNQSIKA